MRMVLRVSGSRRMLSGRASFSMTTIFHRSAGRICRWTNSMQPGGEIGPMQRDGDGLHASLGGFYTPPSNDPLRCRGDCLMKAFTQGMAETNDSQRRNASALSEGYWFITKGLCPQRSRIFDQASQLRYERGAGIRPNHFHYRGAGV